MIYRMTLKDSADEMTFDLLEVPIVDKDIEGAVDNVTLDGNQYTDYLWLKKQFIQKWSILCDDEYTRLRGFYTRQFENADVPSYRLYYGDDIIRNSTLSGERIELSISGVADGTMSLTQMDGNIEQDGTPAPSAPVPIQTVTGRQTVTVAGKNLLRNAYQATQTINGVTITSNADGTITANGTATGTINFFINGSNTQYNISAGTYTLSTGTNDSDTTYFMVVDKSFSGEWSSRYASTRTITVPSGGGTIAPRIVIRPNATLNNVVFKPMAEQGSTATTFEPYKAQEYEINLGKNLFDKDNANVLDGYVSNSAIVATNNGYTIWIPCEPNATYTIQKMNASPQATTRFRVATTEDEPILGRSIIQSTFWNPGDGSATNVHTITTAQNSHYLVINIMNKTATTTLAQMLASIQIERGSTASSYSAYFEPIELCKIGTYQDRIYKENGKWWLYKELGKVVLDGSEDWHKSSNTQVDRYWYNIYSGEVIPSFHQIYSDKFFYQYNVPTVNAMWVDIYQTLERLFVNYAPYNTTTVTGLKTWLASNPTTVYYPLATPTTTEITNEEILEGLEGLVDEAISVGLHNIYTDTPNALPTLTFDLTEYLSKSTTIIPETAVRLTLTDGGVINACGCRKDVQLTMRETIE